MCGDFYITQKETTLSVWQALNYHLIFLTLNVTILWRMDPRLINVYRGKWKPMVPQRPSRVYCGRP